MAKNRVRKKPAYQAPQTKSALPTTNPSWFVPVMVALFIIGLVWIVVFYVSPQNKYPIPNIGYWNLAIGFAFLLGGLGMSTRWR